MGASSLKNYQDLEDSFHLFNSFEHISYSNRPAILYTIWDIPICGFKIFSKDSGLIFNKIGEGDPMFVALGRCCVFDG